jgi:hypothetical protein
MQVIPCGISILLRCPWQFGFGVCCRLFYITSVLHHVTSFQFALKLAVFILYIVVAVSDISELMEASSKWCYIICCYHTQTLGEYLHT